MSVVHTHWLPSYQFASSLLQQAVWNTVSTEYYLCSSKMQYLLSTKVKLHLYQRMYHDKAYSACAGKDIHILGFSKRV